MNDGLSEVASEMPGVALLNQRLGKGDVGRLGTGTGDRSRTIVQNTLSKLVWRAPELGYSTLPRAASSYATSF